MQVHTTPSFYPSYRPIQSSVGESLTELELAGSNSAQTGESPEGEASEAGVEFLGARKPIGTADGLPGEKGSEKEDILALLPSDKSVLPTQTVTDGAGKESVEEALLAGATSESVGVQEKDDDEADGNTGELELSEEEQQEVERLQERDREVRTHEQAHVAAGGQYVRGGVQYEYASGPDGRRYAVGGEVSIDTSPVSGDPDATIRKAQAVRRAALAPAEPSGQDRSAAAAASQMEAKARQERLEGKTEEGAESEGSEETAEVASMEALLENYMETGKDVDIEALKVGGTSLGLGPTPGAGTNATESEKKEGALSGQSQMESPKDDGGKDRLVEGLEVASAGERIEKIEVVSVEGAGEDKGVLEASVTPTIAQLDFEGRTPGQLFDIYR
jgi:hypothetical protein